MGYCDWVPVQAAEPLTPGAGRDQALASQAPCAPSAPTQPQGPASAFAAAGLHSGASGSAPAAVSCPSPRGKQQAHVCTPPATGEQRTAEGAEGQAHGGAVAGTAGLSDFPTWSPSQKRTNCRIHRFDRSASVQHVGPVLPATNEAAAGRPGEPAAGVAGELWQPPGFNDPKTLVQGLLTWSYAMQPKDSCIGNLRCRWCMQSLMPGEHLWSASCRCKNKTYHSHMCLRQQPWVHALCEVNSGGYSGLAAAAAASVAPLKPEPDATDVVSVPDTLAPGQGYGVAVPDTLAPGQTCGVVPATPGCLPPEWAQGAAGPAPGGLAQGVTGFPPGFHAAGAAPAAAALPHGHAPGSRVGFGHGLQGQDPACRVDVPRTPQQPQQGPLYIASTAPVGSGPSPVSHPAAGPAGDGRWEGRVDANGVPIAWKIEQARRKREAAAAAAAAAQRAEQAQVLRDSKWDTQVDVRGVPIALKIARARARREQLKRSAEAEPAQALMRARRRLDAEAMQNEAARRAREDAVNKRLLFD